MSTPTLSSRFELLFGGCMQLGDSWTLLGSQCEPLGVSCVSLGKRCVTDHCALLCNDYMELCVGCVTAVCSWLQLYGICVLLLCGVCVMAV